MLYAWIKPRDGEEVTFGGGRNLTYILDTYGIIRIVLSKTFDMIDHTSE